MIVYIMGIFLLLNYTETMLSCEEKDPMSEAIQYGIGSTVRKLAEEFSPDELQTYVQIAENRIKQREVILNKKCSGTRIFNGVLGTTALAAGAYLMTTMSFREGDPLYLIALGCTAGYTLARSVTDIINGIFNIDDNTQYFRALGIKEYLKKKIQDKQEVEVVATDNDEDVRAELRKYGGRGE